MALITGPGMIPDAEGFPIDRPFNLEILGGTAIDATIEIQDSEGNWHLLPDGDGLSAISGNYVEEILAKEGQRFRINVASASGPWAWAVRDERNIRPY